jgi:zinc transport system permease protein
MVSVCASLLGVTLVLKKFSMIGDGLSHVGFGAMTVALALNLAPMYIAVPVMLVSALLLLRVREKSVNTDAAIAMISSAAIAVGVLSASLSGGMNVDVYSYMFGSILAVTDIDVVTSVILFVAVVGFYVLFYNRIFAVTFDESFASASGVKTKAFNTVFSLFCALTVIIGMRIMGTMLISGLIIFPAVTGMQLFSSYKRVTLCAVTVSVVAFVTGMLASCAFTYIPTGAGIVLANLLFFIIARIIKH